MHTPFTMCPTGTPQCSSTNGGAKKGIQRHKMRSLSSRAEQFQVIQLLLLTEHYCQQGTRMEAAGN